MIIHRFSRGKLKKEVTFHFSTNAAASFDREDDPLPRAIIFLAVCMAFSFFSPSVENAFSAFACATPPNHLTEPSNVLD